VKQQLIHIALNI